MNWIVQRVDFVASNFCRNKKIKFICHKICKGVAIAGCCLPALLAFPFAAQAQNVAEAASGPPLNVSIRVDSSSSIPCYGTGRIPAINRRTALAQDDINKQGGVHGRPIQVQVLDGSGQAEFAIANVKKSLADPQLLAMVGVSNDYLGRTVFSQLKDQIGARKVPFITSVTDRSMFDDFGHVFSTEPSRSEEGLPLIAEFIKFLNISHVGFVGGSPFRPTFWAEQQTAAFVVRQLASAPHPG